MGSPPWDSPVLADLGYTLRRCYVDDFLEREVSSWAGGKVVLDLGGTRIGKRGRFDLDQYPHRVIHVNLVPDRKPDVQADAHVLPFKRDAFDAAICAELLEHVYQPQHVLREIYRVLKVGGMVLITVPFLVPVHSDPEDFGRYTDAFWRKCLKETGFIEVRVERQGLFWSVLLDLLRAFVTADRGDRKAGFGSSALRLLLLLGLVWGRRRAFAAERDDSSGSQPFQERFTTGFGIVARKSVAGNPEDIQ